MSEYVWLLWFEQERKDTEDTELLIGVYQTEEAAQAALERVKDKPGFRDYPEGLKSYRYTLNEDSWKEGFVRT